MFVACYLVKTLLHGFLLIHLSFIACSLTVFYPFPHIFLFLVTFLLSHNSQTSFFLLLYFSLLSTLLLSSPLSLSPVFLLMASGFKQFLVKECGRWLEEVGLHSQEVRFDWMTRPKQAELKSLLSEGGSQCVAVSVGLDRNHSDCSPLNCYCNGNPAAMKRSSR